MLSEELEEDLNSLVGKTYEKDFTRESLQERYPKYDVRILMPTTITLTDHRTNRIRVWLDSDNKVTKAKEG